MNIYLVVEGPVGEKRVYTHWIPLVNPALKVVKHIDQIVSDNVIIYSGGGYPNYFNVIEAGILDVSSNKNIDRLVIAIDSEEMSYEEKRQEIDDFIGTFGVKMDYKIVVQHFCLETWALGNQVIVSRNTGDTAIRQYRGYFDVLKYDPALLPAYPPEDLNRSQFAELYLRRLLNDKYKNLTYSKRNPTALFNNKYFERVKTRFDSTGHISSFEDFLKAFV
jgi:hypothetical protein